MPSYSQSLYNLELSQTAQAYQADPQLLRDHVILVTGAGDGIGRVAALSFAQHGATVILLGRTVEKLEQVYDEIEQAGYPQPAIYPLDLSKASYEDFAQMAAQINETFPVLHGLLHNASILSDMRPISDSNTNNWQDVMQINVNAMYMMTKALLPLLKEADNASILLTSSSVGRKGRAFWGAYAVSKFATEGFAQVLADELESTSNIRVNTINPGATNTQMRRRAYPAEEPSNNPLPEAIMPSYLFLLGKDSIGITGEKINAQ